MLTKYIFFSFGKHWKGVYIHLNKTTHRFYLDRDLSFKHDQHSNVGFKIMKNLDK